MDLDHSKTHTHWGHQGEGESDTVWLNGTSGSSQSPDPTTVLGERTIRPNDGMAMLFVPEGTFQMGSDENDSEASADELPQHSVTLDAFWIDHTEVSNAQYSLCVNSGACTDSIYANTKAYNGSDHPAVGVSWKDADNYCRWAGGRLPTEAEWEYAAKGKNGFIYPWGNVFDGYLVNSCDLNCNESWADGDIDDGYQESAPVGSFPGGASWVGALDMAGNVWEWIWDWCAGYTTGHQINPDGPDSGHCKIIRGGAWASPPAGIRTTHRIIGTSEIAPSIRHPNIGFRCVMTSPEVE